MTMDAHVRKTRILLGICAAIFLAGIAGCIWVLSAPGGDMVNILQDGEVLYTLNVSTAGDQTFDIACNGRVNTIQIEAGKIRVLAADCPDNTCVHMGWLTGSMPIVCLPNRLTIEYIDAEGDLDATLR